MIRQHFLLEEKSNMTLEFNFAIILLPVGPFGGAQRRFTNLFFELYEKYSGNAYYFISYDLYKKVKKLYAGYPLKNVIPIGKKVYHNKNLMYTKKYDKTTKSIENEITTIRKFYKFLNNLIFQYSIHREIKRKISTFNIKVLLGVYSGIMPLYFYLQKKKRDVGIIFCNMDSWFRDVLPNDKKYWYRKYSSFNYALEKSDYIDFLSPFILNGIRDRGIMVKDETVSITPCSFTDYSKCRVGNKQVFQVAFSGRLEKDKNPDIFIDAATELTKKYPEIIFHIMGEGRLSAEIERRVKETGLTNIKYHGFHPQPTEILADTSVFVSIQTTNNYPSQSVLEAMGCGNAIIASDVGDTRMFVNEENGVLIQLNKDELMNAIEKLYLEKEHCRKLGENAFNYVRENHTVEKMAEYYIDLFNKAYKKINKESDS